MNFESMDARLEIKGNSTTLDTTPVCFGPPSGLPCLLRASFGCSAPLSRPLPCDSLAASLPIACAARGLPLRGSASRHICSQIRASRPPSRTSDGSAAAPSGLAVEGPRWSAIDGRPPRAIICVGALTPLWEHWLPQVVSRLCQARRVAERLQPQRHPRRRPRRHGVRRGVRRTAHATPWDPTPARGSA